MSVNDAGCVHWRLYVSYCVRERAGIPTVLKGRV